MDGPRGQLIGLGHDLQLVAELEVVSALREPGVFFTERELIRCAGAVSPLESLAGGFSAKEALFKALPPMAETWFWTDAELVHDRHGAPRFRMHGPLAGHLADRRWEVAVSLSHSGGFVSSVVMVTGPSAPFRIPGTLSQAVRRVLQRIPARPAGASQ
jgi:holo-[acyl-carrier protein] synthase